MKTYTYTEARQQLAGLLDEASRQGEVRIRRRDGRLFALQPVRSAASPLDIPPVTTDVTLPEILAFIREGREAGLPTTIKQGVVKQDVHALPQRRRRRDR